ncbi:hypothetical protein QFW77_18960 [Luteimonas sp. RD2P54]|uniref:Amidohydrolase 3 domain-containing protein n=1 Tax=Luteimonas endophytica TaxID=3042023 RepID=A0ABT6JE40_9GAMM|nr:hypothetical protein [Luteimonas endophytica]MDH5825051.1 hypothetical protein [Luteimonas endophytica]
MRHGSGWLTAPGHPVETPTCWCAATGSTRSAGCRGLPASVLRIADRGVVRAGAIADLVLFDPGRVRARSGYADPLAQAEGFDLVVLNGRPAFEDGERVGCAGRLLRRGR